MNVLFSMAGSLMIGLILGVFFVMFGEGMQVFAGLSPVGIIIGTVAFTVISIDAVKNERLDFLKLSLLNFFAITLAVGFSSQLSEESGESPVLIELHKAAPWTIIMFLVFIALIIVIQTYTSHSEKNQSNSI